MSSDATAAPEDIRDVSPDDDLLVERTADGVVVMTLNRPDRMNAVTPAMFERLPQLFDEVAANVDDRVLILTGAGDHFCSGADVGGFPRTKPTAAEPPPPTPPRSPHERALQKGRRISEAALALHRLRKPTIAAVNGTAAGGGLAFALGCDFVLAAESARFSSVFVRRALTLDLGATWLLPRAVGAQWARYIAMTGDWVSARDAERIGLALSVHPDGELLDHARDLARRLAALPPLTLTAIKDGLERSLATGFAETVEHEARTQAERSLSAEHREAIAAFREKRQPSH